MHEDYHSPAWFALRDQVIDRDGGLCVFCRNDGIETPAETAHHLTYAHGIICDPKWLIATCWPCHEALHGYEPNYHWKIKKKKRQLKPPSKPETLDGWVGFPVCEWWSVLKEDYRDDQWRNYR
jgi:5-methylcytosine-specific restriction endonuclease McrA